MSKFFGRMKSKLGDRGGEKHIRGSKLGFSEADHQYNINFGPNDYAIAVMGVTGTGKSTFISLFTDEEVGVGHGLASCTKEVGAFGFGIGDGRKVHLIDTPGFDDTHKSDTDVLREIAGYLGIAYKNNIRLSGIIYLHRITDPRLTGSALKNLRMFNKLCGPNSLPSVILVTSWWSKVDPEQGARHEKELTKTREFWGAMIDKGSTVFRHDGSRESAMEIVDYLLRQNRPVVLDIQDQMINKGRTLDQTTAGRAVQDEISRLKDHFAKELKDVREDRKKALKERDDETARQLKSVEESFARKLQQMETDRNRLHENMETLQKEREKAMEQESIKLREEMRKIADENARVIRNREFEIDRLKLNHKHDLEIQEMRNRNERLLLENQRLIKASEDSGCFTM